MQKDYIDLIEPTPHLYSKKCKFISFLIKIFFKSTTILSALIVWYLYDYFIAIATLLLVFIIMGIVRSKIRNDVIPLSQSERHYNDDEIANWYTAKKICDDILEQRLEKI